MSASVYNSVTVEKVSKSMPAGKHITPPQAKLFISIASEGMADRPTPWVEMRPGEWMMSARLIELGLIVVSGEGPARGDARPFHVQLTHAGLQTWRRACALAVPNQQT